MFNINVNELHDKGHKEIQNKAPFSDTTADITAKMMPK